MMGASFLVWGAVGIQAIVLAMCLAKEWRRVGQAFFEQGWLAQPLSAYPYWGLFFLLLISLVRDPYPLTVAITIVFIFGLYQLAYFDALTGFLPDRWTLTLLWLGLLVNSQSWFVPPDQAILGAVVGYVFLYGLNAVYSQLKNQPGLGGGDMKLLAALGALCGLYALPYLLFTASVLGLLFVVGARLLQKRVPAAIPFGPFLAGAGGIWLLL